MTVPEISIKLVLVDRKGTQTNHRFRGAFEWEQLLAHLDHLRGDSAASGADGAAARPRRRALRVTYRDDENDLVTVATAIEWAECVRLHVRGGADQPLRLFASRPPGPAKRSPRAASAGNDAAAGTASGVFAETTPSVVAAAAAASASPASSRNSSFCSVTAPQEAEAPPQQPASACARAAAAAAAAPPPSVPPLSLPCSGDSAIAQRLARGASIEVHGEPLSVHALQLLSALYCCDAAAELMSPASRVDFSAVMTARVVDEARGEVALELQLPALRSVTIIEANKLLECDDDDEAARGAALQRALRILRAAIAVFPRDGGVLFCAATAESRAANVDGALALLRAAFLTGSIAPERALADPDLVAARAAPGFAALLVEMSAAVPAGFGAAVPAAAVAEEPRAEPPVSTVAAPPPPLPPLAASVSVGAPAADAPVPVPAPPAAAAAAAPSSAPASDAPVPPAPVRVVTPPPPETPRTTQLMTVVPTMTAAEAKKLLARFSGRVDTAINFYFNNGGVAV